MYNSQHLILFPLCYIHCLLTQTVTSDKHGKSFPHTPVMFFKNIHSARLRKHRHKQPTRHKSTFKRVKTCHTCKEEMWTKMSGQVLLLRQCHNNKSPELPVWPLQAWLINRRPHLFQKDSTSRSWIISSGTHIQLFFQYFLFLNPVNVSTCVPCFIWPYLLQKLFIVVTYL